MALKIRHPKKLATKKIEDHPQSQLLPGSTHSKHSWNGTHPPPVSLRTGSEVEAARRGGEVFLGFPTEFWQPHCLQRNGYFMGGPSFDHTRPREQCRRYVSICQHMVGQCTTAIGQHYCTFGSSVWNRWNALSNCEHEQTSRALAPPSATINRGVKAAQWRTVGGNRMYKGYVHIHSAGFFWRFRPTQQHMHHLQM